MMDLHFSIGPLSYGLAFFLGACALLGHAFSRLGAWLQRKEPPRDRIWVIAGLLAATGFLLGSFLQPGWNDLGECRQEQALLKCVLASPRG